MGIGTGPEVGKAMRTLVLGLLVIGVMAAPALASCRGEVMRSATVASVEDGGVLVLADGTAVLLAGIEIPRGPLDGAGAREGDLAAAARGLLTSLAGRGAVAFREIGGRDRHGRLPAAVFLADGGLLQGALLAEGLARVRFQGEAPPCAAEMMARESLARAEHRGLWGLPDFAVRDANGASLALRKGLYDVVEGRVYSVGHGTRMVFLNFGRDSRRDFTVFVAPEVVARLAAAGMPAGSLSGRRIRVRGVIEAGRGPILRLRDPRLLELLGN
jgi:endonuclease YncB( thermonuclease family)